MKNLIQFIIITVFTLIYIMSSSCEDLMGNFLDKPPGVDVTEDTIFSTQINAETFLLGIYRNGIYADIPEWDERNGYREYLFASMSDEGNCGAGWYACNNYNRGSMSVTSNFDGCWNSRWKAIRAINILLDRIDGVPDASQEFKNQAKGQALFLRGLCYFEMLKRYGGVPIVNSRFSLNDAESFKVPRSTIDEVVKFIVQDAEDAAALLPDRWPAQYIGKITKGAALMLKSRTLLYAASPLFNTATPPISLPGENNKLICYGDNDVSRWKLAADAAKAVIDWAQGAGVHLLTGYNKCYQDVWQIPDNEEIILSVKLQPAQGVSSTMWRAYNNFYYRQAGLNITQNWVEKYEKKDGTPQKWNRNGGNNLSQLYSELDPRFDQSIAYNGCYWNPDFPVITMWEGAVEANQPPLVDNLTGYWLRKFVPPTMNRTTLGFPNWYLYRLAEAYLNYAEALNEFQGPVKEAYQSVNIIRNRVGMPNLPDGLSQEQFRERVRNERNIELAFEEHRLWDIHRWTIAMQDGVMIGDMLGISIYKQDPPGTEFSYTYHVFEQRTFTPNMYHIPFLQDEVNKGYLIQNPGW